MQPLSSYDNIQISYISKSFNSNIYKIHAIFSGDEDKKTLEKEIFGAEMIPEAQTYLTFWEKFLELQIKMLITNQENVQNHNYASDPSEWPFLTRGIAYFISKESNVGFKSSKKLYSLEQFKLSFYNR